MLASWEVRKLVEIEDIIKGNEGKTLEFKRDLSSIQLIAELINISLNL
jgi:hypothetical protein